MLRYPIGLQDFKGLIEDGYVYIDKTEHIYQLLQGKYYFFSRPRRFGKSLLLSTIDYIFQAKKELFKGLWIEDKIEWKEYPIIRLDFSPMNYRDLGLENELLRSLRRIAKKYNLEIDFDSSKVFFENLILELSKIEKVVILIDEYDKPIIDYLEPDQLHEAKKNRSIMKNFYGVLKNLDSHIRFLFITGVSKFSKVSIFSDLNHLEDLTVKPYSATLVGYTQSELEHYFGKRIEEIAQNQGLSYEELLQSIKKWYNGYSWLGEKVYNPFSVLNFVKSGQLMNFWFETGTPTFLVKILNKNFEYNFEEVEANDTILSNFDIENIYPLTLLFQTGYLTIKKHTGRFYVLSYPNLEVKYSLLENILTDYTKLPNTSATAYRIRQSFDTHNFELFQEQINILFSKIPYQLFEANQEKYYHAIIFMILHLLGYDIECEISTSKGRIDAVIITEKSVYILEFKINDSSENAIRQIREKEYFKKYLDRNKPVFLVGIALKDKEIETMIVENL